MKKPLLSANPITIRMTNVSYLHMHSCSRVARHVRIPSSPVSRLTSITIISRPTLNPSPLVHYHTRSCDQIRLPLRPHAHGYTEAMASVDLVPASIWKLVLDAGMKDCGGEEYIDSFYATLFCIHRSFLQHGFHSCHKLFLIFCR
jgi:hypothetical protein